MVWIIFFLVILSFPIVYKFDRTAFYIYSLLFPYLGFFILNKIGYGMAYTIMNAQMFAIIVMSLMYGHFLKRNKFYVTYLAIYLIYFMFDSMFQGVSFLTRWNIYKNAFIFLLWGAMLLDDITDNRVSITKLRNFFVGFLVFELLLAILQYIFEPVREFFNISYMREGEMLELRDFVESGYMRGTLRGASTFANFLCDSFAICAAYYFSKKQLNKKTIVLLGTTLVIILFAGIRASLLLSLVVLSILMLKYKQRRSISILIIFLIVIFILGGISFSYLSNLREVNYESGGAARSLTLFNSFSAGALEEQTTFAMTLGMIHYAFQNPLFGIGLHYHGGYLLSRWGIPLEEFSTTDAMLMFEIAEIGIIGMIIYLWPLLYFIKKSTRLGANKFNLIFLFFIMLLSTIVDAGLMTYNYLVLFFFSIVFFIEKPMPIGYKY